MRVVVSNHFLGFKKKSSKKLQLEIDEQVKLIMVNPKIGELKKGDLKGIRVHKFKYCDRQFLLSYEHENDEIRMFTIGDHENFYRKLKGYLK